MKNTIRIVVASLLLGTLTFFIYIRTRNELLGSLLMRVQDLPAVCKENRGFFGDRRIVAIRVSPDKTRTSARDFSDLKSWLLSSTLEAVFVGDNQDFDDSALLNLRNASNLEYLELDNTSVTDESIENMIRYWPKLLYLNTGESKLSLEGVVSILKRKKLVFLRVSESFDTPEFRASILAYSPDTTVVAGGGSLNEPAGTAPELPWFKWD